jgi:cytochrome c oxidase subunit 2
VGNKLWSVLFGVVMVGCFIGFAISPLMGWNMPRGLSSHAGDVDFLYDVILYITAFFFVLTEVILIAFMWKYASGDDGKRPVSEGAELASFLKPLAGILNSQHRVELAWTIVPAVILLYIAFAQVEAWAKIKYAARNRPAEGDKASLQIGVSARQFEWRMRYPSVDRFDRWLKDPGAKADFESFGKIPHADDVYVVNELHIWQDQPITVHLSTRDVIHSFNLPNFRVKQDALPGKMIPVWFRTIDSKKHKTVNCKWDESKKLYVDGLNPDGKEDINYTYDIACAELCGWGHYRMIGRVFVHEDENDFMNWLIRAEEYHRQRDGNWWEKADKRIAERRMLKK